MLIFCSCQNKSNTAKYSREDLEGTWAIDMEKENILRNVSKDGHREYPPRHFMGDQLDIRGFYFYGDSCEYKAGFYDYTDRDNGLPLPIGSKTTYKIAGDTLKIWDLSKSEWRKLLIQDLKSDTLILRELNYERFFNYIRLKDKPWVKQGYDEIVTVVINPYYGDLWEEMYYLNKYGDYFYQKFDVHSGNLDILDTYHYRLADDRLDSLFANFDYIDVHKMYDSYFAGKMGERVNYLVCFLREGELEKVIDDDDGVAPDELQWGYIPLIYLRREVNMSHITNVKECSYCERLKKLTPSILTDLKSRLDWNWGNIGKEVEER